MYRPLADLLEDSIRCAEAQIESVKALDVARLRQLTATREDLLFLIQAEGKERLAEADEDTLDLVFELRELDERLNAPKLGSRCATPCTHGAAPTYAPTGVFAPTVRPERLMSTLYNNINVGSTGLRVASTGLNVTSHNVANVNTEGFSRRSVTAATRDPVRSRGLLFGTGSEVSLLGRTVDRMVDDQLVTVLGQEASAEVAYQTLSAVESYLDEDALNGPQSRLREFFDSLIALEADPSTPAAGSRSSAQGPTCLEASVRPLAL